MNWDLENLGLESCIEEGRILNATSVCAELFPQPQVHTDLHQEMPKLAAKVGKKRLREICQKE